MIAYSKYRSQLNNAIKSWADKPRDLNQFLSMCSESTLRWMNQCKTEEEFFDAQCVALDSWITACNKYMKSTHYFLEEGLADFMVSSVRDLTADYWRKQAIPEQNSEVEGAPPMAFFIHFPAKEREASIGVAPQFTCRALNPEHMNIFLFGAKDYEHYVLAHSYHVPPPEGRDGKCETSSWIQKLVYGFSLYLDAFPDTIVEAREVKHVKHYHGNTRSIRGNEIARSEQRNSISPHFRRGHFRMLQSDKFKNKQGQAIFIKGTFVKGKAYDVLADAE